MLRSLRQLFVLTFALSALGLNASALNETEWLSTYQASTHVFYAEIAKILPEPQFKTGLQGVYLKDVDDEKLRLEPIVWPRAKLISFDISENFKAPVEEGFEAFLPDPNPDIWVYIENTIGDAYLAKPQEANPMVSKMNPGDTGLFYIRYQLGSNIPIVHKVEVSKAARDSLALLRENQANPQLSLAQIIERHKLVKAEKAAKEAAEFRVFEDEYYKILRVRELEIRRSLLEDLVVRMGFEGRWDYYAFKERYALEHGDHVSDSEIPSGPQGGKEKLWHDISGELKKIDVILKARR